MSEAPPLPEHLGPLNPQQAEAVTHLGGPLLILAGAGSGKTRVLTRRIAYLLHAGVDPEQILAVTFTNKAAAEMKERVADLVGGAARKVWVSTFHSACCRILRTEAEHLGYTTRFSIYDDDDQMRILRQLVADLGYDPKVVVPKAIRARIDHFKNRRVDVDTLVREKRARRSEPFVRLWEAYEDQLRSADALDFNDLVGKVVTLFEQHPEVLHAYRDRFRHVLVDEYQDTNRTQYLLLHLLASEHRNLSVVGDDDQSIYGFRGADVRNIRDFTADFPDARAVYLEQNYRCTERILAVANAVIARNDDRIDKKLWTGTKLGGARVTLLVHDDPRAEARWIAEAVRDLMAQGRDPSEIAVVYRTNATSQPFERSFQDRMVPYRVVGGRPFYARREIRDALSFLRLIANPNDDAALLRVVNVPPRGIGAKTVTRVRELAAERGEPLLKAARSMPGTDRGAKAVRAFVVLIDELAAMAAVEPLPVFVQQVLERTGYAASLREEGDREANARLDNLNQLLADAAGYRPDEDDDLGPSAPGELLHAWLDRIALAGQDDEIPEGGEVTLMTVHSAKGLEFPIVFVANMVQGQFPHSRSAEDPESFKEERRLTYVAFTRAQDRLFISRCRHALTFDSRAGRLGRQPVARSPFLDDLPDDAVEGALPTARELPPGPGPRKRAGTLPPDRARRMAAFLARHGGTEAEEGADRPDGAYRTRPISSMDQLAPGVRVLHDRLGVGEIVQIKGPKVYIACRGRIERVGVGDPGLQILQD